MYRDGGPLPGDSDTDIRIVLNEDCDAARRNAIKQKLKAAKVSGTKVSLNYYDEWGDIVANYSGFGGWGKKQPAVHGNYFREIRSRLCWRDIGQGGVRFYIHRGGLLRVHLAREYGPAWFLPLPMHGLYPQVGKVGVPAGVDFCIFCMTVCMSLAL